MNVTDSTFDNEVLDSELPVLVDFWAAWCGPCRAMAPILDQLAIELDGKLKIVKYDNDANQKVAAAMNVRSLPTLVLFRDGQVVGSQVGALPPMRLADWIEKTLWPKPGLLSRLFGSKRTDASD